MIGGRWDHDCLDVCRIVVGRYRVGNVTLLLYCNDYLLLQIWLFRL